MTRTRPLRGAAAALACLAAFAAAAAEPPVTDAETLATLDKVLAGDHRSDENRARDKYRHPKETLQFFGFRQDMAVMEVSPGGGGWYTEVLAPPCARRASTSPRAGTPIPRASTPRRIRRSTPTSSPRAPTSMTARKSPHCRRRTP